MSGVSGHSFHGTGKRPVLHDLRVRAVVRVVPVPGTDKAHSAGSCRFLVCLRCMCRYLASGAVRG
eukprot:1135196-Rhodomonas_salina.7